MNERGLCLRYVGSLLDQLLHEVHNPSPLPVRVHVHVLVVVVVIVVIIVVVIVVVGDAGVDVGEPPADEGQQQRLYHCFHK